MGPAEDEEGGGLEEEATSGATAQGSKGTGRERRLFSRFHKFPMVRIFLKFLEGLPQKYPLNLNDLGRGTSAAASDAGGEEKARWAVGRNKEDRKSHKATRMPMHTPGERTRTEPEQWQGSRDQTSY